MTRYAGVLGALAAITVVALGVVTWLLIAARPADGSAVDTGHRLVEGTVVNPASCTTAGGRDVVEVRVDGKRRAALLNGCGQPRGAELDVEIPVHTPPGMLQARLPGSGVPPGTPDPLSSAVLTGVAGVAGALLASMLIRPRSAKHGP